MTEYRVTTTTKTSDKSSDSLPAVRTTFGQNSDSFTPRRLHIDVQTDTGVYEDVAQFLLVMTQRGMRKWQVVIDALRFYMAFLSGNPRQMLQKYPHLLALLNAESEKSSDSEPSLFIESKSIDLEIDQEKEKRVRTLAEKLSELARMNYKIYSHRVKLERLACILDEASYTPAHLDRWVAECWPRDYRYKPGIGAALHIIEATIAQVDALPPQTSAAETNRYLLHEHGAPDPDPDPEPVRPPIPAYKGPYSSVWFLVRDELEWVMGSTAFVCYLRPLNLVQVDGSRFVFVAPDDYRADEHTKRTVQHSIEVRIEKYQRPALPAGSIHVEILLESEYHP